MPLWWRFNLGQVTGVGDTRKVPKHPGDGIEVRVTEIRPAVTLAAASLSSRGERLLPILLLGGVGVGAGLVLATVASTPATPDLAEAPSP